MECVQVDIKNKRTIFTKVSIPQIESDNDVIIEVSYAGLCGTDLHIIHGEFKAKDHVILGHEIVGKIFDVSSIHSHLKKGDRVAINPNRSCGMCTPCRTKKPNFCASGRLDTVGIFSDGGWARYCKVHVSLVSKLPESLSLSQTVICEPLSCIIHGLDNLANLEIGSNILIIGAGIIGLLWSCVLHHLGHRKVVITEPNEKRRQTLNNLDLEFKYLPWGEVLEIQKLNPSYRVDFCIVCTGNVNAMQAAFPLLRYGAVFLIFGVSSPEKYINVFPFELFEKEITISGTRINTPDSFERAISFMEAMSDRYLNPEKLNMKFFALEEHEKALESFLSGSCTKIVFKI